MASIYGVSLKKITVFKDHEGVPCCQADVYYNGKKLGFWSQDSWGGPDRISFDPKVLQPAVDAYKASGNVEDRFMDIFNVECLLGELANLHDMEKQFKKGVKYGYSALVMSQIGEGYYTNKTEDQIKSSVEYKTLTEKTEKIGYKVFIYTDMEDFKVA